MGRGWGRKTLVLVMWLGLVALAGSLTVPVALRQGRSGSLSVPVAHRQGRSGSGRGAVLCMKAEESAPARLPTALLLAGTAALALGANFLGVSSSLLSSAGPDSGLQESVLASLYPINGLRRITSPAADYSYLIPDDWRPDQKVMKAQLQLSELPLELRKQSLLQGLPDSAWVSSTVPIENFSVIKSSVQEGFGLRKTLGPPPDALAFLSSSLAPAGSDKTITAISAAESTDAQGHLRYVFEYVVNKPSWRTGRHTVSIVMFTEPTTLFTATVVAPEDQWAALGDQARRIADSFQLAKR